MGKGYKLSFTAAALSTTESLRIAEVYLGCRDWQQTREIVRQQNLLQSRTSSRTIRVYRELSQRLQLLADEQLDFLVGATLQEQRYLLWYAVCKRYRFIREFAVEVLYEKLLGLDLNLTDLDYDAFFNRKADWHEELDDLADSTRYKLKQVLFLILKEAGLISESRMILEALLTERLVEVLRQDADINFRIFPLRNLEAGQGGP